ncbi:hypothetical protein BE11_36315 [Sorangium cellulosum]|nr:hypothetical protein BE11_36315 [Sorangium cellulosum]
MGLHDHVFRGSFLRLVHVESPRATGRHDETRAALDLARARLFATATKIADPADKKTLFEHVPEDRPRIALAREWFVEGDDRFARSRRDAQRSDRTLHAQPDA